MDPRDLLINELREAVRVRDDFLAIVAHELRNPLTPILLCLQLIRAAERSGDRAKAGAEVNRLERLIEHFAARVRTLLEVAQMTSNKFRANLSELNLSELTRTVVGDYISLISRSGSELKINIQDDVIAHLDPLAVSEILENLLSNAIKYGDRKPIELSLVTEGEWARLSVRDNGVGIDSKNMERIFERFERVVEAQSRSGFGIGLWLTRSLAESMGGSITVIGRRGAGSLFTVSLPIKPQGAAND